MIVRELINRIIGLKIYIISIILLILGSLSYGLSCIETMTTDFSEILKDIGLALSSSGLLLLILEYFLHKENFEAISESVKQVLIDDPKLKNLPDENRLVTLVKQSSREALENVLKDSQVVRIKSVGQPNDLIRDALINTSQEILILGLSLRNFVREYWGSLRDKILSSPVKVRILAIDKDSTFVSLRTAMWWNNKSNMTREYRDEIELHYNILQDIITTMGRGTIEVKTYNLLPSCYMLAFDNKFFISNYLVNRSVSDCIFLLLDEKIHADAVAIFRENFEDIWNHSNSQPLERSAPGEGKKFITIAASRGNAIVFIKHRKRGLELPGGWLNQGESLSDGARRKFEDETGFKFHFVEKIETGQGYIAFGKAGANIGQANQTEVLDVLDLTELPDLKTLSFQEAQHIEWIKLALAWAKMSKE